MDTHLHSVRSRNFYFPLRWYLNPELSLIDLIHLSYIMCPPRLGTWDMSIRRANLGDPVITLRGDFSHPKILAGKFNFQQENEREKYVLRKLDSGHQARMCSPFESNCPAPPLWRHIFSSYVPASPSTDEASFIRALGDLLFLLILQQRGASWATAYGIQNCGRNDKIRILGALGLLLTIYRIYHRSDGRGHNTYGE